MSLATKDGVRLPAGRAQGAAPTHPCLECGFELWNPVARLGVADVGLYDDARFPGRLILSLREHFEHLDEVPEELSIEFMRDAQRCSALLRVELGADRVNFAVLGNHEAHVHAHLVPRRPSSEPLPDNSPWQDPRPRTSMPDHQRIAVLDVLTRSFG